MLVAQSLIEYTSLSSFVASIEDTASSIVSTLDNLTPQTWLMIVGIAVLTLFLFKARNRRRL